VKKIGLANEDRTMAEIKLHMFCLVSKQTQPESFPVHRQGWTWVNHTYMSFM